jgi:MerR family mercuric resistance operon transcriptional regulator
MTRLSIGQVARLAGLGVETVRFYERRGLLAAPERGASGYRQYSEDAVARLRFIRRAKELGFSLKEIHELIALRIDPYASCAEVKERAAAKIADIEVKIRDLQKISKALLRLTASCPGRGPVQGCSILEALDLGPSNSNPTRS